MKKSEAIKLYLGKNTHPDLAELYTPDMEVQLNVAKGSGERIEAGNFLGKPWPEYTDGAETWKNFRIPYQAMSDPKDNDNELLFNIEKHTEGIGLTGWDWRNKLSRYVAFDFDAMLGHSDKHSKKLSDKELLDIQQVVTKLPFLTLRKSTSGRGLHLYIYLEPISTQNHTEHAALARALLSMIAGLTSYDFTSKVDIAGGMMWIYHRKMLWTDGLKLIRKGEILTKDRVPLNWKDHEKVVTRQATKIPIYNINDDVEKDAFDKLTEQRNRVKLDISHLALINYLNDNRLMHWWDADKHMLITHTAYLRDAHKALKFKGEFHTEATGREYGTDTNCYAYPLRNGAWVVRKFGMGSKEHNYWTTDQKGWTRCYFNRDLTLEEVARIHNAVELDKKTYMFPTCQVAIEALAKLKCNLELPEWIYNRPLKIKELNQENKYLISINKEDADNAQDMSVWAIENKTYRRIYPHGIRNGDDESSTTAEYDDMLRHIISEDGTDLGWVINVGNGEWREEPIGHIKLLLNSKGITGKDSSIILGGAVSRAWTIVNIPFADEYPGDRRWNRSRAKFRIAPTLDGEHLSYPTWNKILNHCGRSLDDAIKNHKWCKENNIVNGGEYLKLWFASLIKYPKNPLPYLGLYGDQDSGKSTIHEAFCQLILDGGYARADNALISDQGFNGELEGSILAIIEETNVNEGRNGRLAYNRLKDWVTSNQISVHVKGMTPVMKLNYTHWIHCANEGSNIPVFPGDTRVTLIKVDSLSDAEKIPKRDLWNLLTKEAPDFLAALSMTEIPDSKDRLMIPVIRTIEKEQLEFQTMDPVAQFFKLHVHQIDGAYVSSGDLYKAFLKESKEEAMEWSSNKFARSIPKNILRGRISVTKTQDTYYANISLDPKTEKSAKWVGSAGSLFLRQGA